MALKGKIAAIVSDTSVVINLGSVQGVKPGMRFRAIFETPPIPDPDNPRNSLGNLVIEIGRLQVQSVLEKMSFCELEGTAQPFTVSSVFSLTTVTPKVDQSEERLVPPDSTIIKVGTTVVQLVPEEQEKLKQAPPSPRASSA